MRQHSTAFRLAAATALVGILSGATAPAFAQSPGLELGMPMSLAAEAEGIGRTTIYDWIERFPEFAEQITRARAQGAKKLTKIVFEAGPAHAQWLLERRYRDDYAPPKKEDVQPSEVRITIEGGLPARPKAEQNAVAPPSDAE